MKTRILFILLLSVAFAANMHAQKQVIQVWPGIAPGSESWTQKEIKYQNDQKQEMVRNVVSPTLTVYLPDAEKANGTAVIVCPGGGFRFLSWETEGTEVAEWLAARGVTAFVLKYRTVNTGATPEEFQKELMTLFTEIGDATNSANNGKPEANLMSHKIMNDACLLAQEDGRQAIRLLRERAVEWGIKSNHIGIIGFSAGGMLALGDALKYDKSCRPDFVGAIYAPWIGGEVQVDAPPIFVLAAGDDKLASPGSLQTYNSWKAAGKDAEIHLYSKGGHGFGMQMRGFPVDSWIERFGEWMKAHALM